MFYHFKRYLIKFRVNDCKKKIKKIRSKVNFWLNHYDVNFLHELRLFELKQIKYLLPKKGNILEIGAGTGFQSKILKSWNYDVKSIDLEF